MDELIVGTMEDKEILSQKVFQHIRKCQLEPESDELSQIRKLKLLFSDIRVFVKNPENEVFCNNLKIRKALFSKFIIN